MCFEGGPRTRENATVDRFSRLGGGLLTRRIRSRVCRCVLSRTLRPNTGLPGRFTLNRGFQMKHDAVHRTIGLLSDGNVIRIQRNSNACIIAAIGKLSSPLGLHDIRSGGTLTFSLIGIHLLLRPNVTRVTTRGTAPRSVRQLQQLYRQMRAGVRTNSHCVRSSVTFRAYVTRDDGGLIIKRLVPIVSATHGRGIPIAVYNLTINGPTGAARCLRLNLHDFSMDPRGLLGMGRTLLSASTRPSTKRGS